jgi:hypothetical protein
VSESPDTLVKFCTADTAHQILGQQQLRWSAPNVFNDPFEADHRTALNFEPLTLLDGALRTAVGMIFSPDQPRGDSPLTTVIRRWRDEQRFATIDEAEDVLRDLMARIVDQRQTEIDELLANWRYFTRHLRICCFSSKADNLACWRQFGDYHRGLAIRFDVNELTVNPHKVSYQNYRPEITTLKEQLNSILYNERLDVNKEQFLEKFLVKSPVYSHEQEWRCFYPQADQSSSKQPDDSLWYDDHRFASPAVKAIYLGAAISTAHKKALVDIVHQRYPDCKIFQAGLVAAKYELEFQRLKIAQ